MTATGDKKRDPAGAWEWVRGPGWWREIPNAYKALSLLIAAFFAGVTFWAIFSTQVGLPKVVAGQGARIDQVEARVAAMAPYATVNTISARLDSLCAAVGLVDATVESIKCAIWAQIEGKDPARECSQLRPRGPWRNGNGGEQ